jgi:hypothetical protein
VTKEQMDGLRLAVLRDELERQQAENRLLSAENTRLRAALQKCADLMAGAPSVAPLTDQAVLRMARAALAGTEIGEGG